MRYRFDKAAFFRFRVKYGYVPSPSFIPGFARSTPTPGAGAQRQHRRLLAKLKAQPDMIVSPASRQVNRAHARRGAKILRSRARA